MHGTVAEFSAQNNAVFSEGPPPAGVKHDTQTSRNTRTQTQHSNKLMYMHTPTTHTHTVNKLTNTHTHMHTHTLTVNNFNKLIRTQHTHCLLYTSDAADES